MLTISNLRLPVGAGEAELKEKAAPALGVRPEDIVELTLTRQSIDARKKQDVHLVCSIKAAVRGEARILRRAPKGVAPWEERPYQPPAAARTFSFVFCGMPTSLPLSTCETAETDSPHSFATSRIVTPFPIFSPY